MAKDGSTETDPRSLTFILNEVPRSKNRTRYQHVSTLTEATTTTLVVKSGAPDEIRHRVSEYRSFSESALSSIQLLFPLWVVYATLGCESDIYVSDHRGYSVFTAWLASRWHSGIFIADIWDLPSLPLQMYTKNSGIHHIHKALYHGFSYLLALALLRKASRVVLSIHPRSIDRYGIPEDRVVALTNGVAERLRRETLANGTSAGVSTGITIVYVGHVNEMRKIPRVVEYISDIDHEGVTLHLIGPTTPEAREEIRETDTDIEIELHGYCSHERALEFVSESDIGLCLVPKSVKNYRFSYPIKLFEYGLFSVATVCSDTAGIRRVVTHGEDALLVDPDDQSEISEAVTQLVQDEALRDRIGEQFEQTIENYYWEDITREFERTVLNC